MKEINYNAIVVRILKLVHADDRPQKELAEYLGKTRQIFYDWKAKNNPTLTDLFKISKYFGVPLEYIISGNESPIDDELAALIVKMRGLTQAQKESVYALINEQVENLKKKNDNGL